MDGLLDEFLAETAEMLEAINLRLGEFGGGTVEASVFNQVLQFLHTLKGTCGFLRLNRLEALSHAGETLVQRCGSNRPPPQAITLMVETIGRIDALLRAIRARGGEPNGDDGDLIFHLLSVAKRPWPAKDMTGHETTASEFENGEAGPRATGSFASRRRPMPFAHLAPVVDAVALTCEQLREVVLGPDPSERAQAIARLCAAASDLQHAIEGEDPRPIGNAWRCLPDIVRDLSLRLRKEIDLELIGAETPVDARMLAPLKQALVHMVRNSADHGLEPADQRLAAGKGEAGRITVRARREDDHVVIELADDGRGLGAHEIAVAAVKGGLLTSAELTEMDEAQIHRLIFCAGLSTAPEVAIVSGRGIGMDAVRSSVAAIGGRITVSSQAGKGTKFEIEIPEVRSSPPPEVRRAGVGSAGRALKPIAA